MSSTSSSDSLQRKVKIDESRRHPDLLFLDLSTIVVATDNFSPFKKLGQGGFGPVYKVVSLFYMEKHH